MLFLQQKSNSWRRPRRYHHPDLDQPGVLLAAADTARLFPGAVLRPMAAGRIPCDHGRRILGRGHRRVAVPPGNVEAEGGLTGRVVENAGPGLPGPRFFGVPASQKCFTIWLPEHRF